MTELPTHLRSTAAILDEIEASAIALSDAIGTFAEPGLREYRSADALERYLEENGFRVSRGVAGMPTAFVAEFGSRGPVLGAMCEYDGTPGDSQAPLPY